LQVRGNTLQQAEKFKYLGMAFTSDGRRNKQIDTRIGKANAVLCELYRSVVTKWELTNTAKLAVFKSVFAPLIGVARVSCARGQNQLGRPHPAHSWQHRCKELLGSKGASKADPKHHMWLFLDPSENFT